MIIRQLAVFAMLFMLISCTQTVETEFGLTCSFTQINPVRQSFISKIDGSITFLMDESADKTGGKVFSGSMQSVAEGKTLLSFPKESAIENCKECIFLFIREDNGTSRTFRAESAEMDLEKLYYNTKGRVTFMKGSFKRIVFYNIEKEECIAIEDIGFIFY